MNHPARKAMLLVEEKSCIYPVLLGTGKRLFSDGTPPRELSLVSSKAGPSGVVMNTYKPSGPLRTGTVGDGSKS